MGLLNQAYKTTSTKNSTTIIGKDTFIRGGIETEGDIFIDGRFEGNISSSHSLTIGKKGIVVGDIKAQSIYVSGKLDGVINVGSISILNNGYVLGKLTYSRMNIEEHGVFNGESRKKNSSVTSEYANLDLNAKKTVYLKNNNDDTPIVKIEQN
jgi:cytoskeletal protein CcmA (bactofilin family)